MSGGGISFWKMLFGWIDIVARAHMARHLPPDERKKVVSFGVHAAIYAFITALFSSSLLLFNIGFGSGLIIGILVLVVAIAFGIIGTLVFLVSTLVYWFCQLSINRSAGTWITLVFVIIGLALAAAIPLIFLNL